MCLLLSLSPLEAHARPVDLSPEVMGAIVAECEAYPEPPAFPCRATCALCGESLAADEDDGTGHAHQVCSDDAFREIENDEFNEWVESMERTYAR